ncbi:MAG: hypothetical protein SGBAC_006529 [Bacillariaceae sp.]
MYQPNLSEPMLPKPDRASNDIAFHSKRELFLEQWRLNQVREQALQHQQKLQQLQQQKIVEEQIIVIDAATCLQMMKHNHDRREKLHAAELNSLCTKRLCQIINLPFDYGQKKFEADMRRQRRLRSKQQNLRAQQEAIEQAEPLAKVLKGIMKDPEKRKLLLVRMTLARENPRSTPEIWPAKGSVIPSNFSWKHYPPLVGGTS